MTTHDIFPTSISFYYKQEGEKSYGCLNCNKKGDAIQLKDTPCIDETSKLVDEAVAEIQKACGCEDCMTSLMSMTTK